MDVQTLIKYLRQTVERFSNADQILTKDGLEVVKYWSNSSQILVKFWASSGQILIKNDIESQGILPKTQPWLNKLQNESHIFWKGKAVLNGFKT